MDPKEEMFTLISECRSHPAHAREAASARSASGTREEDESRSRSEPDVRTDCSSSDTLVEEGDHLRMPTEDHKTVVDEEKENLSVHTDSPSFALRVPKRLATEIDLVQSSSDEDDLVDVSEALGKRRKRRRCVRPRRRLSGNFDADHYDDADDEDDEEIPSVHLRKCKPMTKVRTERWRAARTSTAKEDQESGYFPESNQLPDEDPAAEQRPSVRLRTWRPMMPEVNARWSAWSDTVGARQETSLFSDPDNQLDEDEDVGSNRFGSEPFDSCDNTTAPALPASIFASGSDSERSTQAEAVNEAQASPEKARAQPATRGRVPRRVVMKMPSSFDSPTSTGTPKIRSRFYAEPLPPGYVYSTRLGRAVAPPGRSPLTQREVDFDVWRSMQTPDQRQRVWLQYTPRRAPTEESPLVYTRRRAIARADGLSNEQFEHAKKLTAVLVTNIQEDSRRVLGHESPFADTFKPQQVVDPAVKDQLLADVVTLVNSGLATHRRNMLSRCEGRKTDRPLSITQRAVEDAIGAKLLLVGRYLALSGMEIKF